MRATPTDIGFIVALFVHAEERCTFTRRMVTFSVKDLFRLMKIAVTYESVLMGKHPVKNCPGIILIKLIEIYNSFSKE